MLSYLLLLHTMGALQKGCSLPLDLLRIGVLKEHAEPVRRLHDIHIALHEPQTGNAGFITVPIPLRAGVSLLCSVGILVRLIQVQLL